MKGTKTEKAKPKYITKALRCPDGTRKYIRGKTQAELDKKVRAAQVELGMGININDNTTVAELAQIWIDVYKRPNIKPQSLGVALSNLNCHILPVIGAMRVRDVKPADCARIMAKASHLSKATQGGILTVLRSLFYCAMENDLIARNPVAKSLKPNGAPAHERVPLTHEQVDTLCRLAMTHRNRSLYTFVMLCTFAGLRRSEALGLNWKNVDTDKGVIYVREQYRAYKGKSGTTPTLKTPSSRRDIPIPPVLLAHLSALKGSKTEGYIFDVTKSGLSENYYRALKIIGGLNADGKPFDKSRKRKESVGAYIHPHLLRHTYATRCFEAGLDVKEVQYLMGHSSLQMTMDIYVHYMNLERQDDTARKLAQAFPGTMLAVMG